MKELLELRVNMKYAHLLFADDEGVNLGDSIKKVVIDTASPIYTEVGKLQKKIMEKYETLFFFGWNYIREYTEDEIRSARFLQIRRTRFFEPTGEECGTLYDESTACPICHAGARQIGPLKLRKSSIPRTDLAETIAWGEETIVSEHFKQLMEVNHTTGISFVPIYNKRMEKIQNFYQLIPTFFLDFSPKTIFGLAPFDFSGKSGGKTAIYRNPDGTLEKKFYPLEVFACPNGDNMGLHILSEAYLKGEEGLDKIDFFASKQTVGGRGGLIRPHRQLFCSNRMMRLIKDNKLKGFKFEVAHIVDE